MNLPHSVRNVQKAEGKFGGCRGVTPRLVENFLKDQISVKLFKVTFYVISLLKTKANSINKCLTRLINSIEHMKIKSTRHVNAMADGKSPFTCVMLF